MTSKERMLAALRRGVPDRLPITIHQWQGYHLRTYMGGISDIEANKLVGFDASITTNPFRPIDSPDWKVAQEPIGQRDGHELTRVRWATPEGELTSVLGRQPWTVFHVEHPIKNQRDAEIYLKYWPRFQLDQGRLAATYAEVGDAGIVRGFVVCQAQPGVWQEFAELVGTQQAILWAMDEPDFVHHFLQTLNNRKLEYIHEQMRGAKFDLIEHGGGAASSTVISPTMFDEFCVPYDKQIADALHSIGLPLVYHTCGGMMANLTHIPANGCDASETLSPPGVGGDIKPEDRMKVKEVLGSKVALIGGIDQGPLEKPQRPEDIAAEVQACFETFGKGGGYICSASDHFFFAPVENLKAMARAARECTY